MQDIALDPRIVLDGVEAYFQDFKRVDCSTEDENDAGVEVSRFGRSSIVRMPDCGHWSMLEDQGSLALERTLIRLMDAFGES